MLLQIRINKLRDKALTLVNHLAKITLVRITKLNKSSNSTRGRATRTTQAQILILNPVQTIQGALISISPKTTNKIRATKIKCLLERLNRLDFKINKLLSLVSNKIINSLILDHFRLWIRPPRITKQIRARINLISSKIKMRRQNFNLKFRLEIQVASLSLHSSQLKGSSNRLSQTNSRQAKANSPNRTTSRQPSSSLLQLILLAMEQIYRFLCRHPFPPPCLALPCV